MSRRAWPRFSAFLAVTYVVFGCVTITPVHSPPIAGQATSPSPSPSPASSPSPSPTDVLPSPTAAQSPARRSLPPPPASKEPQCQDPAYVLEGFSWTWPLHWYVDKASIPDRFDKDEVIEVIKRAFDNVTGARNDCGLPDLVDVQAIYRGAMSGRIPCTDDDPESIVSFGQIPLDVGIDAIGYACPSLWMATGNPVSVDIVIRDDIDWALSLDRCDGQELLEPVLTHEVGHAFGLDHVTESEHPWLTMSTATNGQCNDGESTLGWGDILGLQELYPGE